LFVFVCLNGFVPVVTDYHIGNLYFYALAYEGINFGFQRKGKYKGMFIVILLPFSPDPSLFPFAVKEPKN
jgi:hypothetical protein